MNYIIVSCAPAYQYVRRNIYKIYKKAGQSSIRNFVLLCCRCTGSHLFIVESIRYLDKFRAFFYDY